MKCINAFVFFLFAFFEIQSAWAQGDSCSFKAPNCPPPEIFDFEVSPGKEGYIRRQSLGFTQGLEFHDGVLFESTGAHDSTTKLNVIDLDGKIKTLKDQGNKVFGEGLTILNGRIYQLTWQNGRAFIYDLKGNQLMDVAYPRVGWGLTNNGKELISSDGSHRLVLHDPENLSAETKHPKTICVREGKRSVSRLNELEYVDGKIFANIFTPNAMEMVRIDPKTGCVDGKADLRHLVDSLPATEREQILKDPNHVLNGIAYDKKTNTFFLTGKNWPVIFKAKLVNKGKAPSEPPLTPPKPKAKR